MIMAASGHRVALGLTMLLLAVLLVAMQFHMPGADMVKMQDSTVRIICETKGKTYSGSGFVVGTDPVTYAVTNDHVARCADTGDEHLSILLSRHVRVPIDVVLTDPDRDLAIVRSTQPLGRPAVQLADTTSVVSGAPVTVIGFPGVADVVVDTEDIAVPSVSRGNVSRVTPGANGVRYFQHTATTNPGNSGGPVYDEAGNVIGVNSRKATNLTGTTAGGRATADRVANGEGIAAAVNVAELLPLLKERGVPYVMASFTPTNIAMILLTAAVALLLAAGGILVMTSPGRDWLLRRAAPANLGRAVKERAGRIRFLGGALAGMEVAVSARVVLGRDPAKAQIVFPGEDAAVSRQHCEIRFDSAAALFEVRDLGSRNGTFIANGTDAPRRLAPEIVERVAPGQNILVGSSRNRLVLELS
jgi:Trypsin-like peptidase domain/FHA domain